MCIYFKYKYIFSFNSFIKLSKMACSKYQYVKNFEKHSAVLPQTFILVRIDGKGFTNFCKAHKFHKPNDIRCINLMNSAAFSVVEKYKDIFLAYGQSDQYSFIFKRDTEFFNRREQKILTTIVSTFSSNFVFKWKEFFHDLELKQIPSFDGRLVVYPNIQVVKDYFKWRQVDCHINNLYNTVFWSLVKSGKSNTEVQNFLSTTNSGDKNQILFKQFGINYNTIEQIYRKGTTICYYSPPKLQEKIQKNTKEDTNIIKQQFQQLKVISSQKQKTQQPKIIQKLITQQEQKTIILPSEKKNNEKQELGKLEKKKNKKRKFKLSTLNIDMLKQSFWENIDGI